MHPILLLWDIDDTLLSTGGAGMAALCQAFHRCTGIRSALEDIEVAGRTDRAILREICRKFQRPGLTVKKMLAEYLSELPKLLPLRKGRVYPGVRKILEWSHAHPEVHNGLLTGNVERGAHLKLAHYGLDSFFEFGAFGDDSPDRNRLGPIVLRRARRRLKKDFQIESTWVIGDTPHDIACGRALGCKVLAVATGHYSLRQLKACRPNLVFKDLSDHRRMIRLLMKG